MSSWGRRLSDPSRSWLEPADFRLIDLFHAVVYIMSDRSKRGLTTIPSFVQSAQLPRDYSPLTC
jgi:hypothetical protein